MAKILDGKALAAIVKQEVKEEIAGLGIVPGLAVVIVGDDAASRVYVNNKKRDCVDCGIKGEEFALAADAGQERLLELIHELNARPDIHGILVQMPLPRGFCEQSVIAAIAPEKDVDAFTMENVGRIMNGDYELAPCTPAGVMAILDHYGIDPAGKHCVVVGRSNIVGKPMAMLLLHRHATVTICHSRTPNLSEITRQADILVSAVGKIGLITADMVKPEAIVVDVAINRNTDTGKLCGDVDFEGVRAVASHITPVPGGVGPMTRAVLMQNTLIAARRC
ncbi:MAG: bifunctional methylenetetrahydrofolate dehydrogenase/methenyltetrahydrofolate cyclohydrolase FolD [Clostridiales bacterium]|jgi:methylenetetrahydrofolate dehydrogenase (NADP+)/methenyltetrahydrofolate cyclohydrolase|nr:bifunctional methylenetetrahydrofolate dehydrogenase/methenyltetrahydrofolate cyclohydrolase FolD [Clostridiales bacterium]